MSLENFSIIVPVYNGAETLDACLEALVGQSYPRDRFEVIVVNDGSTDETPQIAARYPVRLIHLESNEGRIVARNSGARAARFETLVFNDARVIPEGNLLAKVSRRGYEPLLPSVVVHDGSPFARFFHLLRCRLYAPHYPLSEKAGEYFITPDNFDDVPKGTTNFVCDRSLWLKSQPRETDRYSNDDTKILRQIVRERPILRTDAVSVTYRPRSGFSDVMIHTYQRGPRFADYYLRPGGKYRLLYLFIGSVILFSLTAVLLFPGAKGAVLAGFLLTYTAAVLYLSRSLSDLIVVGLCLPAVVLSFGLGILKWQVREWIGGKRSGS
ncbi:MAG TPA: glycosyltransferase [Syntrophales bacterium]|nr:glycosyltransferase [Syntrophales bacterium]